MIPTRLKLADIAELAGVSTATVSRVFNDKPGVAETTRASVMAAMESLGHNHTHDPGAHDHEARIAVMVPELGNPTFAAFANELALQLAAAGQHMFLCSSGPGGMTEEQYLDTLLGIDVAGLISVSGSLADSLAAPDQYQRLIAAGVPAVFINAHDPRVTGAFFSCSDAEAISSSVAHLRSLGHTRIGLSVGQQRYQPTQRKIRAFVAQGLPSESVVSTIFSVEGGQAAASRLLDTGHTAIVCGSDMMALGAIREARTRGLEVPRDLSVVGYDDSSLMAFTDPALTTVRQPVSAMCKAAVDALLASIEGQHIDSTEMLFHPDLIIRQSTGPVT